MTHSRKLRRFVKSFKVKSLANGEMLVQPEYVDDPLEEGCPPVGVLDRMAIASEIERILNGKVKA